MSYNFQDKWKRQQQGMYGDGRIIPAPYLTQSPFVQAVEDGRLPPPEQFLDDWHMTEEKLDLYRQALDEFVMEEGPYGVPGGFVPPGTADMGSRSALPADDRKLGPASSYGMPAEAYQALGDGATDNSSGWESQDDGSGWESHVPDNAPVKLPEWGSLSALFGRGTGGAGSGSFDFSSDAVPARMEKRYDEGLGTFPPDESGTGGWVPLSDTSHTSKVAESFDGWGPGGSGSSSPTESDPYAKAAARKAALLKEYEERYKDKDTWTLTEYDKKHLEEMWKEMAQIESFLATKGATISAPPETATVQEVSAAEEKNKFVLDPKTVDLTYYGVGNIRLDNRPVIRNGDGTISTLRPIGIWDDVEQKVILIPTIIHGKIVSDEEAIDYYFETGRYLGKFDTSADAKAYAKRLQEAQEKLYTKKPAENTAASAVNPDEVWGESKDETRMRVMREDKNAYEYGLGSYQDEQKRQAEKKKAEELAQKRAIFDKYNAYEVPAQYMSHAEGMLARTLAPYVPPTLQHLTTDAAWAGIDKLFGQQTVFEQQLMTENEESRYQWIYDNVGPDAAKDYLNLLGEFELRGRVKDFYQTEVPERAEEDPFLASIHSTGLALPDAVYGLVDTVKGLFGVELNANDVTRLAGRMKTTIRQQVAQDMDPVAAWFYGTGMSISDFLMTRRVFGKGSIFAQAGIAGGNTQTKILDAGGSSDQAAALGVIAAGLAGATEKMGYDRFFRALDDGTLDGGIKAFVKALGINFIKSGAPGALEEMTENVGNTLFEYVIMGAESEIAKNYEANLLACNGDKDKAWAKTALDYFGNLTLDGLSGFVSEGFMADLGTIGAKVRAVQSQIDKPKIVIPSQDDANGETQTKDKQPGMTDNAATETEVNDPGPQSKQEFDYTPAYKVPALLDGKEEATVIGIQGVGESATVRTADGRVIPISEVGFGDFEIQALYEIAGEFPDSVNANRFLQIYRDSGVEVPEFLQLYLDVYQADLQRQAGAQGNNPDSLPELPFDVKDVAPPDTLNFSDESLNTINELFEREGIPPPEDISVFRETYAPHPDTANPSPVSLAFDAWVQANPDKPIRWKGSTLDIAGFWDTHQDEALLNDRVVQTVPEEMFDKEKFDIAFDSVYTRFQNDAGLAQAIEASKQAHGGNVGEDVLMKVLFEGTGRDGLPQQISQEEFDAMAEQGALTMFRGIKGAQYMEQFKTGQLYYGKGVHGNGIYFAIDKNVAVDFAAGDKANVTEMILDPEAKIISEDALQTVKQQFMMLYQDGLINGLYVEALREDGRLATILGFDAIYSPKEEYVVVLDRSKLYYVR